MVFGDLSLNQWAVILLVLLRAGALLATLPFFGSPNLPAMAKAGLSLALALCLAPVVKLTPGQLPQDAVGVSLLCLGEVLVGAILGFTVRLLLAALQIMGQMAGFQMGFSVANVLDPMGEEQISVLSQFAYLMAVLIFFAVDAHHWFFKALADSFVLLPPGNFHPGPSLFRQIMAMGSEMFALSVRLGAPVMGALLLTQVVMGILAKTVPQMNILMVGVPVTITVGLVFLSVSLLIMAPALANLYSRLGPSLAGLLKAM